MIVVLTDQIQNGNSENVDVNQDILFMESNVLQIKSEMIHLKIVMLQLSLMNSKKNAYLVLLVALVVKIAIHVLLASQSSTILMGSVLNIVVMEKDLFLNVMMETIILEMDAI